MADPSRFGEFLDVYVSGPLDGDERFALMEVLIQCIEDMDLPSVESSPQWNSVAGLLRAHAGRPRTSSKYRNWFVRSEIGFPMISPRASRMPS